MDLLTEMNKQIASRMALLNDMMATGALNTPLEYLESPVLLVMHMSNDAINTRHKQLMRTRKRWITFGLNGRIFILSRKLAISVVREEMSARGTMANAALSGAEPASSAERPLEGTVMHQAGD